MTPNANRTGLRRLYQRLAAMLRQFTPLRATTDPSHSDKFEILTHLLYSGCRTTAKVIDVDIHTILMHKMLEVDLLLDLRQPDREDKRCVRSTTILSAHQLPKPGDLIGIKYLPQDMTYVLVL